MLAHLPLALLLQVVPAWQPRLAASPRTDSLNNVTMRSPLRLDPAWHATAITDAAGYAVLTFLSTWRTAWLESADWRGYGHADIRLRDVHCHFDGSYSPSGMPGYYRAPSIIHHGSRRSMCPDWYPSDEPAVNDERVTRDASLTPALRAQVATIRAVLLDSLAKLDKLHPSDAWITGARVRFLIDEEDPAAALKVAERCTAGRVWCAQLVGFALDADGQFIRADSAYDAAAAAMTPKERCEWTNLHLLLDGDARSAYDHMSCDQQAVANERLWWLATPLFSDTISDRRAEDFTRKVLIQLHSALPWDERYDWRGYYGGESVSDMLVRYGWPAFSAWAGAAEEADHAGWMGFYDSTRTATAEYPSDRLHLFPDGRALTDPFHAPPDAWQINMPALSGDDEPAAQWWPAEHYARAAGPIVQLSDQTVFLRRDDDVLLATASDLTSSTRGHALHEDTSKAVLIRSTGPHHVERLQRQVYTNASSIVLTARVPAKPALFGAELPAAKVGELSARTRFGAAPPPSLAALVPGETAVSQPVLLAAAEGPPPGPDAALPLMLGSAHVSGPKVGIYWESYGYNPGDSVDVAVVIIRHEPLSKTRRLGMLLHVAHDPNGSVAVRWQEPQAGHDSFTIPARVPIQARSVRLDLSRIEPGHYVVQVIVAKKTGGLPVVASRDFVYDGMQ